MFEQELHVLYNMIAWLSFTIVNKIDVSTGEEYCESTGKYNSMVELFTSTGRDIESAISTGELNGRRILQQQQLYLSLI